MNTCLNLLSFLLIESMGISKITLAQNISSENHFNRSKHDTETQQNYTEDLGKRMSPILTEDESNTDNTHPIQMCIVLLVLSVIVLYASVWRPRKKESYIVDAVSPQYIELEEKTKMEYCLSFDEPESSDDEWKSTEKNENSDGKRKTTCCGLSNVFAHVLQFKRTNDIS